MTKSQLAFEAHLKKRECKIGEGLNTNERVEAAEAWQASHKVALEEAIEICKSSGWNTAEYETVPKGTMIALQKALGLLGMVHDKKMVQTLENHELGLMADIGKFLEEMK